MVKEPANTTVETFPFRWAVASDTGKVRDENQDSFLVEPEVGLFLVSDGIGGHRGGALASKIVAEDLPVMIENRLGELKSSSPRVIRSIFKKTIVEQSKQLQMEAESETGYKGMGATLVLALLRDSRAYIANLGDSRIYRLRNNRFVQLTKDHSVVSELLSKGRIELTEAQSHVAAGQITHYVGMGEKVTPFIRTFALKKGDRLLLCTDGLTDMVNDKSIAAILTNEPDCRAACDTLIAAANAAGGHDNITVVIIDWCRHL
jgi:protein phosphatase